MARMESMRVSLSACVIVALSACTAVGGRGGDGVILQWETVTQRENGEPLGAGEISRYEVEQRACGGAVSAILPVVAANRLQVPWPDSQPGCLEFRVRAVDQAGLTSAWSEPVRTRAD